MIAQLRRVPFTIGMIVTLWTVGLATGSVMTGPSDDLMDRIGLGCEQVAMGRWWNLVSSLLWSNGLAQYVGVTIVIAVLCGMAEQRIGTGRTALLFVVTHVFGTVIAVGAVTLGAAADDVWSTDLMTAVIVSPSGAAFGVGLAASSRLTPVWRRRLRLTLVLTMMMLALYAGGLVDLVRLFAGLSGLVLGALMLGRGQRAPREAPSRVESRLLVAMIVAASAVGPLVATVSQTAQGPLSVLQFLLLGEQPEASDVLEMCSDPTLGVECKQLQVALRLSGPGPAFLSIVPVLLLLVLAEGLRRGRRFAWWGTLALNLALTGLGIMLLGYITEGGPMSTQDWLETGVSLSQPLFVIGLLLATRRRFDVAAPPGVYRKFAIVTGATQLACSAAYLVGGYLLRDQFELRPSFGQLLEDLPMRFAPPGYLGAFQLTVVPNGLTTMLLYQWIGVVFWAVVITASLLTFVRARVDSRGAGRARELLTRYGGTSMSHMITWRGNSYWFSPGGEAVIAYRVISAVALTTGEPVGAPEARKAAVHQFAEFCAANGWTPCFYGVGEQMRTELTTAMWSSVQVAEETVVPLPECEFRGKKWQDVRTALNKAKTLGITAELVTFGEAQDWMTDQIRALSSAWLADKGLPEMGFTLGRITELADHEVRCLVAVDENQKVHGVTSWLPVRRDGEIVAWTLDFMRRGTEAFPGVMEFLIASMVVRAREEGAEFLSLSGAPLARRDRDERIAPLQRVLDLLGRTLEPVYGFRSLLAFKAKFQPQYRPLFMSYPDAAALPSIGNAITRAYLPKITFDQGVRLVTKLVRRTG